MKDTKYLEIIKAPVITEKSENAKNQKIKENIHLKLTLKQIKLK